MTITSATATATTVMTSWLGLISAAQPLLAAGLMLGSEIVALFKKAHPTATNDELNQILMALVDASDVERTEIAKERAEALAEIAAAAHPSTP